MKIAQQFTAGNKFRDMKESVKRTAEILVSRPLHGLEDPNLLRFPTDESVGYFQPPASQAH